MGSERPPRRNTESAIGDIAYLARSPHRVPALVALTERPRSRAELRELCGVSSSTIRRTLDEFEARVWVRKNGHRYATTRLGEAIAAGMAELIERLETERNVRDVWRWLPDEVNEHPLETWTAMTVTVAEPNAPYRPISRFESLLADTSELRLVHPEIAMMEPCFGVLYQVVDDGVDVVLVARPDSHAYFRSTYPERSSEMMQRDTFTPLAHDDLPSYGVCLLDDRVAITGFDQDSGAVEALVDTDVATVREWARSVYETYTAEGDPVEP